MATYTVAIIGAGVVGCAVASKVQQRGSVLVLEQKCAPGLETSQFNSGVIHSGIHLPPSYQKAELARRGSSLVSDFCAKRQVPMRCVGMHIVVAGSDVLKLWPETRNLFRMFRRAHAQDIPVSFVTGAEVRKRETHIHCLFGLQIPQVSIIDQMAFCRALAWEAETAGVEFQYGQPVIGIHKSGPHWIITTPKQEFVARTIINTAGLYADLIAGMAGYQYHQVFYRGEYYEVDQLISGLSINGLVYPVHQPGKPGLGVHLTPTIDGRFLLGPNARQVSGPTEYFSDPTPAEDFWHDVKAFLPGLKAEHLRWAFSGIRPKLTAERKENDFVIVREQGSPAMVNCIGIESPGLTAALAIAEKIECLLSDRLGKPQTTHV